MIREGPQVGPRLCRTRGKAGRHPLPAAGPAATALIDATELVQSAVLLVEQKYAAANAQHGTGPQKLAAVLQLSGPVVTQLLKQTGINADTAYVQSLVSAVVAILNVQQMPGASAA